MDDIRYKLIHSTRQNVQNGDSNDAKRLSLTHRIITVGQMQHCSRGYNFSHLEFRGIRVIHLGIRKDPLTVKKN